MGMCTALYVALAISTALGLGWKTRQSQQRQTNTWRMQDEYIFF